MAATLHDERKRQTALSLARERRGRALAWVLLLSGGLVVASGKWYLSHRPVPVPSLEALVAVRFQAPKGAEGRARKAASPSDTGADAELDLSFVDALVERFGRGREAAIPILQAIQSHYRYLPDEALRRVCERTEITPAQIAGSSSFYAQFRRSPVGRHVVRVCHGTACHVAGAEQITRGAAASPRDPARCRHRPAPPLHSRRRGLPRLLQPGPGDDDRGATPRVGSPPRAPARRSTPCGHEHDAPRPVEFRVGLASCGIANGGPARARGGGAGGRARRVAASAKAVGCGGMCHREPLLEVVDGGGRSAVYTHVTPDAVPAIVRRHLRPKGLLTRVRWIAACARRPALGQRGLAAPPGPDRGRGGRGAPHRARELRPPRPAEPRRRPRARRLRGAAGLRRAAHAGAR